MSRVDIVSLGEFADALNDIIDEYSDDVVSAIEKSTRETGNELKDLVKEGANIDTGKYKRAITVKHSKNAKGLAGATVYVKSPHYRLAHLLERPHALRNGSLSTPNPHWEPARKAIEPRYIKKITEEVEDIE